MSKNLPGHCSQIIANATLSGERNIILIAEIARVSRRRGLSHGQAPPPGIISLVIQAIWSREHVPNLKSWSRDSLCFQAVRWWNPTPRETLKPMSMHRCRHALEVQNTYMGVFMLVFSCTVSFLDIVFSLYLAKFILPIK